MPQYTISFKDGSTASVEAPEGASQEEVLQAYNASVAPPDDGGALARASRRRAIRETGPLGQLVRGLGAGAVGMTGTALQGAAELLPDEYEEPVQEGIAGLVDYLRPELLVGEDEGSTAQQIAATFGQALGSTAPLIAAGAVGGLPAAAALGAGAGAGEAGQRARRAGASDEEQMIAVLQGTGVGLTEAGPLGAVARLFRPAAKAASIIAPKLEPGWRAKAKAAYDYTVRRAGPAAAEEAAQESIASSLQNLIERGYNPEQDIFDAGVFEEGAYGAGVGATIQALADLAIRGRNRRIISEAYAEDEARDAARSEAARQAEQLQEAEGIAAAEGEDYLDSLVGQFRDQAAREEAMRTGAADMLRRGTTAPVAPEIPEPQPGETFEEYRARVEQQMRTGAEDVMLRDEVLAANELADIRAQERLGEEQLDLFPVDLEQTRRRLGPRPTTPEQEQVSFEDLDESLDEGGPQQLDILDEIEIRTLLDQEEAAAQAAEQAAEQARARAEQTRLASDIETTDARVRDAEAARSRARRLRVLQGVVENTPTRQDTTLIKAFRRALTDAGFTETAPLPSERRLIKRAIDFQRAQPEALPPIEETPESAANAALEEATARRRDRPVEPVVVPEEVTPEPPPAVAPEPVPAEEVVAEPEASAGEDAGPGEVKLSKVAPGWYEVRVGEGDLDRYVAYQPEGSREWFITYPGAANPDEVVPTLRMAREWIERHMIEAKSEPEEGEPTADAGQPQQTKAAPEVQPEPKPAAEPEQEAPPASERREQARPALAPVEEDTVLPEAPPAVRAVAQAAVSAPSSDEQAAAMRAYIENPVEGTERTEPRSPEEAMNIMAYDLMVRETSSPIEGTGGRPGSGSRGKASPADRALLWVRENGGVEGNTYLNNRIAYWRDVLVGIEGNVLDRASSEETIEKIRARRTRSESAIDRMFREVMKDSPDTSAIAEAIKQLYLSRDKQLVQAVDIPLHPEARAALLNGDLQGAVDTVATTNVNPFIRQVAKRLSQYIGNTTLELVDGLTDTVSGKPIAGRFSPRENKIYLDRTRGVNTHTVLHELVHAAVSAALARPSSPAAKQLVRLYNELRPQLSGTYAATDVDEFVAEVLSNPDLQAELARIALTPNIMGRLVEGKVPKDGFTFWDYFKNTIGNAIRRIMGRAPVRLGQSVTDVVSQLTDSIMAPAPAYRGGADLALAISASDITNKIADGVVKARRMAPEKTQAATEGFANKAADFLRFGGADAGKKILMGALPLNALTDIAESVGLGKVARDFEKAVLQKEGFVTEQRSYIDAVSKDVSAWKEKAGQKAYDALGRLAVNSTINEVDPTEPRSKYKDDPEKLREWDAMQSDVRLLGKGGVQAYKDLRDTYRRLYNELLESLQLRVVNSIEGEDKVQAQSVAKRFLEDMAKRGQIDPFFPLYREGDFWLRYEYGAGDVGYMAFETAEARNARMEELSQQEGVRNVTSKPQEVTLSNFVDSAPPTAFIRDVLSKLPNETNAETGRSVRDEVLETYMRLLPETALARGFQRRMGYAGAIEDPVYVLQARGGALARDVANMRGNVDIDQAVADLKEAVRVAEPNDPKKYMYDELMARARFAKNPPMDNWAKQLNRGAFVYTLGLNVSSAILNMSQIPLVVFLYLSAEHGAPATWREVGKAYRAFAGSGFDRKLDLGLRDENGNPRFVEAGATPSIDIYFETDGAGGYRLREGLELPDETRAYLEDVEDIMRLAADRGMLHRSLIYDTLGVEEVGPKITGGDKFNAFMGGPFHIAERVNRQVTLLATFRLAKDKLRAENPAMPEQRLRREAAEQAIYQTQQFNGSNLLSTAPRYAQQGVGRVALMYKSFGIAMNYLMAKSAWNMLKNEDPATRKLAMRQLAGVHLSSLLMAGVQGMPIYGLAAMVWGLFQDDDELDPDTIVRQHLGEGWWKGPLVAGFGLDFSTRIGLTDLLWRENPYNREPSPEETMVTILGGPAASIISRVKTGIDELGEAESGEDFYRAVEKLVPAFIANPLQVARFTAQGGIKTRRGDPVYDDIGLVELGGKLIGFAPAEYTYRQEQNLVGKRIEAAVQRERKKLYRRNYLAYMNGDFSEMRRIRENIADFNRRHPDAAITEDTLDRSIEANLRTNLERRYNGVIYNEQTKDEVMEAIDGFRPGFWPFM